MNLKDKFVPRLEDLQGEELLALLTVTDIYVVERYMTGWAFNEFIATWRQNNENWNCFMRAESVNGVINYKKMTQLLMKDIIELYKCRQLHGN